MAIFLYNSLSKKKEEFKALAPPEVKIYSCGVTVYDECHIGHARSLFIFDSFKKYLEYKGFEANLVRNITDVDDKIINRAKEEGVDFQEIRQRYIDSYYRDLESLEIEKADFEPLATENVFYMVAHIKQLIERALAYEVDGDVYFSVRSFPRYGQLSGQGLDEMMTAVRIGKDTKKRDPLDFALWKKAKEGEPSWRSPWGEGRPGWHIECSTMSMRYLRSETLDIHAGGRDLIFPHHENEIAQAEALTGKTFARYWMHHGLLTVEGRKMSKSLGNFVTIQDVVKLFPADIIKMFFLSAHYRSAMDFSFDELKKIKKAHAKIEEFLNKTDELREKNLEASPEAKHEVGLLRYRFEEVMDDDFNTAEGLAVVFELVTQGNRFLMKKDTRGAAVFAADTLKELTRVMGLSLGGTQEVFRFSSREKVKISAGDPSKPTLDPAEVERLVAARRQARQEKDFKKADEIRELLKEHGIIVEDTEKF